MAVEDDIKTIKSYCEEVLSRQSRLEQTIKAQAKEIQALQSAVKEKK